jgi:GT2 family glycosyltransferase
MSVKISVIVPTHNRKESLLQLLDSLFLQSIPAETYEVIVVCDGVSDGTNERVRTLCQKHPQLRLVEQPQSGPAAARNAGAKIARGMYLAFTDDDCLAAKEWLGNLMKALEGLPAVGVEGQTTTIASECTPLTHQVVNDGKIVLMRTCNAACRRDAFTQLGGFEERFPFPHNEDADFAWRLESLGRVSYVPDALIIHPPRPESFIAKARWVRYFESEFLLFARNPDAYRRHRSPSPWITIYWKIFVVSHFFYARSAVKYLFFKLRPRYAAIMIALIFARGWNLIRFFPRFLRASRTATAVGRPKGEAGGKNGLLCGAPGDLARVPSAQPVAGCEIAKSSDS